MNWITIASWAYGFFTPLAILTCISVAIGGLSLFFQIPPVFGLSNEAMWSGGWLFAGLAIVSAVVAYQVFN
jgi:hypothetical protein